MCCPWDITVFPLDMPSLNALDIHGVLVILLESLLPDCWKPVIESVLGGSDRDLLPVGHYWINSS